MEKTSYAADLRTDLRESDQLNGLPQPPLELPYDPASTLIDLPDPKDVTVDRVDLREAMERRRSLRSYSQEPLTLKEVSWLLWATQGVQKVFEGFAPRAPGRERIWTRIERRTLRPIPSSSSKHPFETYLMVNKVEGLKPALYRFLAIEHKLVEIEAGEDVKDRIKKSFHEDSQAPLLLENCAVAFIWTFVPYRMSWRYAQRGCRAVMEIGCVAQNLHLAAEAIRAGACVIDPFLDKELNNILRVNVEEEFVLWVATVGKKRT